MAVVDQEAEEDLLCIEVVKYVIIVTKKDIMHVNAEKNDLIVGLEVKVEVIQE